MSLRSFGHRKGLPFLAAILALQLLASALFALSACGPADAGRTDGASSRNSADAASEEGTSKEAEEAEPAENFPPLPASGELSPLAWGSRGLPAAFDGVNPRVEAGILALSFAPAGGGEGLSLTEGCEIRYTLKHLKTGDVEEAVAALDTSAFPALRGEKGYTGVAFPVRRSFQRSDKLSLTLRFTDTKGAVFTVTNAEVYYGLQYYGITPSRMDLSAIGVKTEIGRASVTMTGSFEGEEFTLLLDLNGWRYHTSPDQLVTCCRLFFDCYPKMYARFGREFGSPLRVTLGVEDAGYEIAEAAGSRVHIHDRWLKEHRTDYDCLTHEFAHVIQNGWDGNYCEYSGYIERFADYCRYVYAYADGYYNDKDWTLNTVEGEPLRENSVRFLVFLDSEYSTADVDVPLRFFRVIYEKRYPSARWDEAWKEIFQGTALEGKTGEQAFALYKASPFASMDAGVRRLGETSALISAYNLRVRLRERQFSE